MGKFSIEWLFKCCNLEHHCIGLKLKEPIEIDGKDYFDIAVLEVIVDEGEWKVLTANIKHGINTNVGYVNLKLTSICENKITNPVVTIDIDNVFESYHV